MTSPVPRKPAADDGAVLRRAVALGVIQGPTELLPVSSSAHLTVVPWLAGWEWEKLDPEMRKSFEVALHAGGAAALLIGQRKVIAAVIGGLIWLLIRRRRDPKPA